MTYVILQKERFTFLDARHNPIDGYRVTFRLSNGDVDWVDVSESDFNKETVDARIQEKIALHEQFE